MSRPDNWFTYPYFRRVILAFYEKSKKELILALPQIEHALIRHCSTITSKMILSKIIIQCNSNAFEHIQDVIKDIAIRQIGDPAIRKNWNVSDLLTDEENATLLNARDILNEWITRRFITVFFEKCINNDRRKFFWLKMSKNVSDFKVFGPANICYQLQQDKRIADIVNNRFQVTQGSVSAFFMHVGDYKLIEFSDPGYAFYAYKKSNLLAPSIDKTYFNVDVFRNSSMPMLVTKDGYTLSNFRDEGRLTHRDGWERVFSIWIKNKLDINV